MQFDNSQFTPKAQQVLQRAINLAIQLNLDSVHAHILMAALVNGCNDMMSFLLYRMRIDKNAFCNQIAQEIAQLPHQQHLGNSSFDRQALEILQQAVIICERQQMDMVAPEYIFWAAFRVRGPIKDIMQSYGINENKMREAVQAYRSGNTSNIPDLATRNDAREQSALNRYAHNMLAMAQQGQIESAIGRDDEIRRIVQVLTRKTKNNPILVGEPGTGKTAIIEGLAYRLLRGDVPEEIKNTKLYILDTGAIIAGASVQGEFEQRIKQIVEEMKSQQNSILFIDEIHLLIGAGRTSGAMDAANILKPALARGEIKMIGATTIDEYRKYIEKDKAFARRFQRIVVGEPSVEDAITILRGIKQRFEHHHRIKILDSAITSAVELSARYVNDRFLPDKAIDLLDEAAALMRIERSSIPQELDRLNREIQRKEVERESLRQDERFTGRSATGLERELAELREKENELNAKWQNERREVEKLQSMRDQLAQLDSKIEQTERVHAYKQVVSLKRQRQELQNHIEAVMSSIDGNEAPLFKTALDGDDIAHVLTTWTGIPLSKLTSDELQQLGNMETMLRQSIIGQERAINALCSVITRNRMGFIDTNRPVGSFVFLGPTGVGKTELAKALAEHLFGTHDMIVRVDMSEYQQEYSVSRLFGAPPGYVGYDQGGQLTEAVRRKPYSVILLDEIEKAHPKVFETLLQVLDDGRMTDGRGRTIDFRNTIIIMTSNLGSEIVSRLLIEPQVFSGQMYEQAVRQVTDLFKRHMAPEFVNRIDSIIMFNPLSRDNIHDIVNKQMKDLCRFSKANGLQINYENEVVELLTRKSYYPEYGARPVRRSINEYVVDGLTSAILHQQINRNKAIEIVVENGLFNFKNVEQL